MFCTQCGVQLEERDNFCSQCGASTGRGLSPVPPKRLVRTRAGKKLAGVCSGFADYLGADPVVIRLLWVVLTIGLPPAGVFGYIIAWIVVPKEPVPAMFTPAPVSVPQS